MRIKRSERRLRGGWRRYVTADAVQAELDDFGFGRVAVVQPAGQRYLEVWVWPELHASEPTCGLETQPDTLQVGALHVGAPAVFYTWTETMSDGTVWYRSAVISRWRPPTEEEKAKLRNVARSLREVTHEQ
jgi:hypothetical protein